MHIIPWMPKYLYSSSYGQNYIYSWCNEENFATGEYINQVPDFSWPLTAFTYCLYSRYFQTILSVWVASILISLELFPAHLIYFQFRMIQFPQALTRGRAGCRLPQIRRGSSTVFLLQVPPRSLSVRSSSLNIIFKCFKPDLPPHMRIFVVSQHTHVW